jgi:hypothetical protein
LSMDVRFLWLVTITTRDFRVSFGRIVSFSYFTCLFISRCCNTAESPCYPPLAVCILHSLDELIITYCATVKGVNLFLFDFYSILFQRVTSNNPVFDAAIAVNSLIMENAEYIIPNTCYSPCRKNRSKFSVIQCNSGDSITTREIIPRKKKFVSSLFV